MRFSAAFAVTVLLAAGGLPGASHAQAPATDPYGNYHGRWRGDFLLSGGEDARTRANAAAQVLAGTLDIDGDGSVHGALPGGGCSLAGVSTAFVSAANAVLDVTLSGCRDPRFNGRFSGRLLNNPLLRYASLRLIRTSGASGEAAAQGVSAIVRR